MEIASWKVIENTFGGMAQEVEEDEARARTTILRDVVVDEWRPNTAMIRRRKTNWFIFLYTPFADDER